MDAREALFVTLVSDDRLPLGLLAFPRGSRKSPLSLEEALAARLLCDRLSAVLSLSSSIARSRQRETVARERADELVVEAAKLEAIIELSSRPRDYLLETLAAGARVAAYSASARAALDLLGKLGASGSDVALEVPVGVDPLGHAALVHLASPRRGGPFVIVDGTAASAHDPAQFRGEGDSSVERSRTGTLVVLNVASLPLAAQDALAVALSERPSHENAAGSASSFTLVASLPRASGELLEQRHLSRALARFLIPNAAALPALVDRPEDLRGLVLDALCKSGVRFDGQTIGIEPRALSALVDHTWPGNARELLSVVERVAHTASGERVRLSDLEAAGFVQPALAPATTREGLRAERSAPVYPPPAPVPLESLVVARPRREAAREGPGDDDADLRSEPRTVRRRRRR
jgi:DNA-binding NtrC family response regulator